MEQIENAEREVRGTVLSKSQANRSVFFRLFRGQSLRSPIDPGAAGAGGAADLFLPRKSRKNTEREVTWNHESHELHE